MALILAVDPERRQHAALACLARELDGHELLSASSCDDALIALDRRTPDLVLLPLLLPEGEESELLSRLRAHSGGADVRALSIPLLKLPDAAPPPPSSHPAWLNQILHPEKHDPNGAAEECEPAVFADLIRGYLGSARDAAADALAAAAEIAKAAANERRVRLLAAARATATWVRARRDRWHVAPPSIAIAPPVMEPIAWTPVAADPPADPSPSFHSATSATSATPALEAVDVQFGAAATSATDFQVASPATEFGFQDVLSVEPESFEEEGPRLFTRASERFAGLRTSAQAGALGTLGKLKTLGDLRRLAALRGLGPTVARWLPRAAVAAVVLTLGVSGRAYWLRTVSAPKVGVAVLESLPSGAQVLVDGQTTGLTPLTTTLSAGTHRVDFKYRGKTRTMDVVVTQGGRTTELVDWTPRTAGRLQINSEPGGARVLIDNVARGVTPLTLDDVALGSHTVVLESGAGSVRRTVTVKAEEAATLNETIYAGWLKVFSPFDLTITEGSRALRLDDRYQVMLPAGPHDIRFENRALGYQEVRHVEVQPGVTTPLSIVAPRSTLTLTTSAPAEVLIDGVSAGHTPLTEFSLELGTRDVVLKSAAGDRRFSVAVTVKPVVLDVDLSKP